MEAIILANTAERVFVGDRPVKPQDVSVVTLFLLNDFCPLRSMTDLVIFL